ncbi:hypothetical protein DMH12_17315 [Streptomyces sp. WAC 04229]|uniref:hypothetical protein n=1 Tax=Streptomyces sp. WAC 04229 TaxID=2203206 RepID=UPI000F742F3B|nr:hypothetical protein [Streptomyces sp. WAC 04229]MCF2131071.1 hypothetical protein [Streptomyces sp. STD 3.1]RSN54012.1 hypothetical protein DMH12_17315 [Streptomyces sp. WAC 04229]
MVTASSPARRIESFERDFDARLTALTAVLDAKGDDTAVKDAVASLFAVVDVDLAAGAEGLDAYGAFAALLTKVEADLAAREAEQRSARGRVRQVARAQRRYRRRQLRMAVTRMAPRIGFFCFVLIGIVVFGIAVTLIAMGSLASALPLFPVAGAAWALARALRR